MMLPSHLKIKIPLGINKTLKILKKHNLNTVCTSAKCPNRAECFSKKVSTFLALGNSCTRNCSFCDIAFDKSPPPPDILEPKKIALCAKDLKLKHIVITMVTRDDLEDQGSKHIAKIIKEVKSLNPLSTVEVLVSDFSARYDLIDNVLNEKLDIFNHNIEAVKSISSKVRHIATYENSFKVLKYAKSSKKVKFIKSGFMVGLSETKKEVFETIDDLHSIGCDIITIGQYLQPGNKKYPVKRFLSPSEFKEFEEYGKKIGVKYIFSSPFVRSSYNASSVFNKKMIINLIN